MNKRPNSNSGRIVPIFANNKNKRLRQALYANPTTDNFEESTTTTETSLDSYNFLNHGDENYEAVVCNETGQQKPQRSNSLNNEEYVRDVNDSDSLSSTRQSQYSISLHGRGRSTNSSSSCKERYTGSNRGGVSLQVGRPVEQENHSSLDNGGRTLQYQTGKGVTNPNLKAAIEQHENKTKQIRPGMSSERFQQYQSHQSKELRSTKQMNMMATPTDKSLKVITATIQSVLKWKQYEDKLALIFEIFGILDSQVSLNSAGNGKNFVIKDKTANLRCTFWEMDRQLPRLTRGQMHRCVGALEIKSGHFNCVSVRPVKQTELQAMMIFLEASQLAIQQQLATLKED